jgi:GNAT superfamily N-acetyltransferase
MRYRAATIEDAPALSRLGSATFVETFGHLYAPGDLATFLLSHSQANWRERLADPLFSVRIAEADDAAAAFATVGPKSLPFETDVPTAELRQLYVLKPWHGAGVAAELMDWALAEARRREAEQMILSVFVDNHRARRFYERYGFEEVGAYHFMVGDHADDDLILRLRL